MTLSRKQMFFFLQALFLTGFGLYQLFWLYSGTVEAEGEIPIVKYVNKGSRGKWGEAGIVIVRYEVDGTHYTKELTRNNTPSWQKTIPVQYSRLFPGLCRHDSFEGKWEWGLILWLMYLIAGAMILLLPNFIAPRGAVFQFTQNKPWIKMTEDR